MGESPPIKAGQREPIPHLETTCSRTSSSAGTGRSQQLQILPSLNSKEFYSLSAYFSCCANISMDANILPGAKDFRATKFLPSAMFLACAKFLPAVRFLAEFLLSARFLACAEFSPSAKFLPGANVFVHFFRRLYFCIFFYIFIKYAPII
jgi:hypothetical protein